MKRNYRVECTDGDPRLDGVELIFSMDVDDYQRACVFAAGQQDVGSWVTIYNKEGEAIAEFAQDVLEVEDE